MRKRRLLGADVAAQVPKERPGGLGLGLTPLPHPASLPTVDASVVTTHSNRERPGGLAPLGGFSSQSSISGDSQLTTSVPLLEAAVSLSPV